MLKGWRNLQRKLCDPQGHGLVDKARRKHSAAKLLYDRVYFPDFGRDRDVRDVLSRAQHPRSSRRWLLSLLSVSLPTRAGVAYHPLRKLLVRKVPGQDCLPRRRHQVEESTSITALGTITALQLYEHSYEYTSTVYCNTRIQEQYRSFNTVQSCTRAKVRTKYLRTAFLYESAEVHSV